MNLSWIAEFTVKQLTLLIKDSNDISVTVTCVLLLCISTADIFHFQSLPKSLYAIVSMR